MNYNSSYASQPEPLKVENLEVERANHYAFPSSTPGYTFENSQQLIIGFWESQTSSQMQNLSTFSNVMVMKGARYYLSLKSSHFLLGDLCNAGIIMGWRRTNSYGQEFSITESLHLSLFQGTKVQALIFGTDIPFFRQYFKPYKRKCPLFLTLWDDFEMFEGATIAQQIQTFLVMAVLRVKVTAFNGPKTSQIEIESMIASRAYTDRYALLPIPEDDDIASIRYLLNLKEKNTNPSDTLNEAKYIAIIAHRFQISEEATKAIMKIVPVQHEVKEADTKEHNEVTNPILLPEKDHDTSTNNATPSTENQDYEYETSANASEDTQEQPKKQHRT
ncbi:hypothetical protein ACH5RR_012059 [Cinchona calisaya]|uniref:Uncharacterized protein n=1 Tax=Cinchona calisaya TaxID=153742 RepID=A0ABD3ACJ8_9GENT